VHHNFDDRDSGYDVDSDNKSGKSSFGMGGYNGRIIFLGDGTEVLTDSDDTEMFDNAEEDKDLTSQVSKEPGAEKSADGTSTGDEAKGGTHPTKMLSVEEKIQTSSLPEKVAETKTASKADEQKAADVSEK
jgi:protein phosphatase 2C family protein 2/3